MASTQMNEAAYVICHSLNTALFLQSPPSGAMAHWLVIGVAALLLWPYLNQNNVLMRRVRAFLQNRRPTVQQTGDQLQSV